ncbi:a04dac56-5bda-4be4-929c-70af1097aa6f [Thermothielavioides terrestris]|uniref:A04dac56-5bda-4be4-929c-70af1097aa6f n=1 Tax=Thermothielavioides terrestris TaxID=2587410 RepID=A0A3S4BBD2_9PEZI|nr:a04dac56-5bda-4be4-929c-70af1097aa6f [Thermothielavioides terrestris]
MTTQQSEGALLGEKPLPSTLPGAKEGLNGSLEVNGHTSPRSNPLESESGNAPELNGETPSTDLKLSQNQGAFAANYALSDKMKEVDQRAETPKRAPDSDIATEMDRVKADDTAAPTDTDMPDAPTNSTSGDKTSEALSPKSQPKAEAAAPSGGKEEENNPAADATDAPTTAAPAGAAEDVTMADAEEQAETLKPANPSEGTKSEKMSDDSGVNLKDDAAIPAVESQASAADTTAAASPPPPHGDASTSEAAQTAAKVPRERDVDGEDEPVAKRTKIEHAADEVHAKTGSEERMEVDQQAGGEAAEAQNLADDALNDKPITEWQSKQIRLVLAGVKKTKAGVQFRLPVAQLWPHLWSDYSAKISNPTDISSMEKRLRGDGPRYATMGEFKQDLDLLVQNSITFNGDAHAVTEQARACRKAILDRLALQPAVEPAKPERKESAKPHSTRHVEPRAAAAPNSTAGPGRPPKGGAASPSQSQPPSEAQSQPQQPQKPVPESPAFALPPGSNGVPLIRRDSTKPESRAKRPVKPAHPKDLSKHYEFNAPFLQPVDPVALNIPQYHKVIKKPMDLGTMANKLASGEYTSSKEFEKDFDLIIKNCRTFNGEDHIVYNQALKLQDLYRAEMSRKDEWMAKHAPVSAAPPHAAQSPRVRDDSESEEAESEPDAEHDEERKQIEHRLATIQKRLDQEQQKINEMVNSGTAEIADVEIAQSVVAMLQKQLMQERAKLANLPAKKPGKPKASKSKKAGGAAASAKKATVAGAGGATGAAKKSGTKKTAAKRKIGPIEKEIIIESIGELEGPLLARAIDLIKKDTGQGENDAGELELDIDMVSEEALVKLYDIALKFRPNARAEKERQHLGSSATAATDPPAAQSKPSKSKKNKPMSKSEQERRIQQLNELRAQAGRQASGSQEPLESVEGNGQEPSQPDHESEDEVDSEED